MSKPVSLLAAWLLTGVLTLAAVAAETEYRCAACGELITKQAAVVDGKLYHPECFRCAGCGESIRDEYVKGTDGHFYHRACLQRLHSLKCAHCGEPITEGNYTTYLNRTYHSACYLRFVAPRCEICGELLGSSYLTDFWGNRFHPHHADEYPVCQVCGRLVWQGGRELDENRWICRVCAEMSVTDPEKARRLLEEVREELARVGVVVRTLGLRIQLVDRSLLSRANLRTPHSHTYAQVEWNPRTAAFGDETAVIEVLTGLPDDMLRGVIAHELMHVWQFENHADGAPVEWREGSANWASSLIYSRMQSRRGQFFLNSLAKSTDPVYGAGYRTVARYADTYGVEAVLQVLRGDADTR